MPANTCTSAQVTQPLRRLRADSSIGDPEPKTFHRFLDLPAELRRWCERIAMWGGQRRDLSLLRVSRLISKESRQELLLYAGLTVCISASQGDIWGVDESIAKVRIGSGYEKIMHKRVWGSVDEEVPGGKTAMLPVALTQTRRVRLELEIAGYLHCEESAFGQVGEYLESVVAALCSNPHLQGLEVVWKAVGWHEVPAEAIVGLMLLLLPLRRLKTVSYIGFSRLSSSAQERLALAGIVHNAAVMEREG